MLKMVYPGVIFKILVSLIILLLSAGLCWLALDAPPCSPTALTAHPHKPNKFEEKYLHLVEMAVTGSLVDEAGRCGAAGDTGCALASLLPYDAGLRRKGNDWPPFGHTMVGHLRLHNIRHTLEGVVANNIPGHFAELGVWRGGASIYAKAVLEVLQQHERKVYVFDAFESLKGYGGAAPYLMNSEATVRHNFDKYGFLDENIVFQKGMFNDSLPAFRESNPDIQIAVLRVDGNFYDSYQDALYYLYDRVPVGGYVIFDDIRSHPAVQQCWADFQKDQGLKEDLTPIDDHSTFFKKTVDVKVNMSLKKAPKDANKG